MTDDTTPRIYVACLRSYNASKLHGVWIELGDHVDSTDIEESIATMLASSPEPGAEEWSIHDREYVPDLGSNPDLDTLAELGGHIEEHGYELIAAMVAYPLPADELWKYLRDRCQGTYKDYEAYGFHCAESGIVEVPQHLNGYIDWEQLGEDQAQDYITIETSDGLTFFDDR